jgi:flagellin-like protein
MMNFKQNEEAVSPVIGVILMVAITVILAAVIAAFVFGMTGSVATTKTVAATTQLSGENIIVTYQGGPDHASVTNVTCSVVEIDTPETELVTGKASITTEAGTLKTGHKWVAPTETITGSDALITVTAVFSDGTEQVILDRTLNVP